MRLYGSILILALLVSASFRIEASESQRKKVLYVDSYNATIWSAAIKEGIDSVFSQHPEIKLKTFYMDTKRNNSEEFKKEAALKARQLIDEWKPDLVITSDDNAAKYLIQPFFLNSDIPFVFCGINGDIHDYGFPADNITGLIEIPLFRESHDIVRQFSRSERIAFIGCNNLTSHKALEYLAKTDNISFDEIVFVSDINELQNAILDIQKKVDLIYFYDVYSVKGFDQDEMMDFAKEHIEIPTISTAFNLITMSLLGIPQTGEEHGIWAANAALKILAGTSPKDIPISRSRQGRLYLNMIMANKLGIKFPVELVDSSTLISEKSTRVLYLNPYKYSCSLYNDIEKGLLATLNIRKINNTIFDNTASDVQFRIFAHDYTGNDTAKLFEDFQSTLKRFRPDVIVALNNEAVNDYLYRNGSLDIPLIICGLSTDITLPFINKENKSKFSANTIFSLAGNYAKGDRISYIGTDTPISHFLLQTLKIRHGITFTSGALTESWEELKHEFTLQQQKSDIIIILDICANGEVPTDTIYDFFLSHTIIPSISFDTNSRLLSLFGLGEFGIDQGWQAGRIILQSTGKNPAMLRKISTLVKSRLFINKTLADSLQINISEQLRNYAQVIE